jgi:hypothetical protein
MVAPRIVPHEKVENDGRPVPAPKGTAAPGLETQAPAPVARIEVAAQASRALRRGRRGSSTRFFVASLDSQTITEPISEAANIMNRLCGLLVVLQFASGLATELGKDPDSDHYAISKVLLVAQGCGALWMTTLSARYAGWHCSRSGGIRPAPVMRK